MYKIWLLNLKQFLIRLKKRYKKLIKQRAKAWYEMQVMYSELTKIQNDRMFTSLKLCEYLGQTGNSVVEDIVGKIATALRKCFFLSEEGLKIKEYPES